MLHTASQEKLKDTAQPVDLFNQGMLSRDQVQEGTMTASKIKDAWERDHIIIPAMDDFHLACAWHHIVIIVAGHIQSWRHKEQPSRFD
jgi:hypothetical protein